MSSRRAFMSGGGSTMPETCGAWAPGAKGHTDLAIILQTSRPEVFLFLSATVAISAENAPPKRRGASIRLDQSPLRRDQISVWLSSPSPFTSEA